MGTSSRVSSVLSRAASSSSLEIEVEQSMSSSKIAKTRQPMQSFPVTSLGSPSNMGCPTMLLRMKAAPQALDLNLPMKLSADKTQELTSQTRNTSASSPSTTEERAPTTSACSSRRKTSSTRSSAVLLATSQQNSKTQDTITLRM